MERVIRTSTQVEKREGAREGSTERRMGIRRRQEACSVGEVLRVW